MHSRQQASTAAGAFSARRRLMFAALLLAAAVVFAGCAQTYYRIRLPEGSAPVGEAARQENAAGGFSEMPSGAVPGTRVLAVGDNARLTLTSGRRAKGLVRAVGDTIVLQSVRRNTTYADVIPARTVTRVELAGKPMTPIEKSIMVLGVPVLAGFLALGAWLALVGSHME